MAELRVLVVDDDEDMARTIADELTTAHCRCEVALSGEAAIAACRQMDFDAVISDVRMDGMDGVELLSRLQNMQPGIPVILLTAEASIEAAVDAVKRGAFEYLTKPCTGEMIRQTVSNAIAARARSSRRSRPPLTKVSIEDLIGKSEAMCELRARIELVARAHSPVLVHGETGTGKELVARAIHAGSPRAAKPFVTVNASAIPENLLESQMFGHAKGAFTGAVSNHRGLFVEADGGTLVLDEIGDMPMPLQAKLLRVLQSGEVRAVGGDRTIHVDVRVIASTHRRLNGLVKEGKFREDLFYRLNVVTVVVPPLRQRPSDIADLATHFLERSRERAPESPARRLSPELIGVLVQAQWPGNVRELESTIERLVVLARHEELTPADLAMQLDEPPTSSREPSDPSLDGLIQKHVEHVLERVGGNKPLAAKLLGIDLSTLYRWQRKWATPDE